MLRCCGGGTLRMKKKRRLGLIFEESKKGRKKEK